MALPPHSLLLFCAAIAGGVINSVAGGGGFICFPALLFAGVPPINANATNTIALWPGTVAATGAYRHELASQSARLLLPLMISSVLGGVAGALLLLKTPQLTFLRMVPWLMLAATIMFVFGGRVTAAIRRRDSAGGEAAESAAGAAASAAIKRPLGVSPWMALLQLVVSVYIGYFGAGAGIVILALLAVMGMENIHSMNGVKTLLASSANGVALVTFILARTIYWPHAVLMLIGAIIGGYGGAWYAQKLPPGVVRAFVIATGCIMTTYFFLTS